MHSIENRIRHLFMKKHYILYFIFISITFTSCSKNKLSDQINLNCNSKSISQEFKNCKEPNGHFEINLPKHFKREFFVSEHESRLYFADTTKELTATAITDVGIYFNKKNIDVAFFNEKLKTLKQEHPNQKIQAQKINFQNKTGFYFSFNAENENFQKNRIEIFLENKNNSYYLISIDTYGEQNTEERFCEALDIIEKSYFY